MTNADRPSEKSVFLQALEIESTLERNEYLDAVCLDAPGLRATVTALLDEHARSDNPLDRPLVEPRFEPVVPVPGTRIGPYELRERIGEGGFGLVFVADQREPVRRRVALKVIKPGMESQEVLARFEVERQAIALMDHPNIARVFDAGVTEASQPYFVMELVRGVPLVEFCDSHRLDTAQRLDLFVTICHAVQHAHQKGVIHRDLKPSNVLVTLQDGRPLAKVIDFGVAKAIGQSLTVRTIYTRFASMVGTPAYMSPEQAEMSIGDVDTRSDVYSLGVLLYELLTGSTPFAPERLQQAGFDELRRIIREEEPPRPSTRLSTLDDERTDTVAVAGRLEPARPATSLRRDLDWIVMKALDKDRNRRYPSAGSLAEDVGRVLRDEPVEARPPSVWYRFTKFARRNRAILVTASLVAATLVLGTAVSVWQARVAIAERDQKVAALGKARAAERDANEARAQLERFSERLNRSTVLLAEGRAHADAQRWADAHEAYTAATTILPEYYPVWLERGRLNAKLGRWEPAAADFARAVRIGFPVEQTELTGVPQLLVHAGEVEAAETLCERLARAGEADDEEDPFAVEIRGRLAGNPSSDVAATLAERVERMLPGEDGNAPVPRGPRHRFVDMLTGANLYVAGWAHLRAGDHARAVARLEESNGARWHGRGIAHPLLAIAHHATGRPDEALRALEHAEAFRDRVLDESLQRGTPSIPWVDWIEFDLNHRRASIVVRGHTPVDDSRFRELRAIADSAVAR